MEVMSYLILRFYTLRAAIRKTLLKECYKGKGLEFEEVNPKTILSLMIIQVKVMVLILRLMHKILQMSLVKIVVSLLKEKVTL